MIINDEILYFLITDYLHQEKAEFPIKTVFMVVNENIKFDPIPSKGNTFFHYICEETPEIIVDKIVELTQHFTEEKIFFIDHHLSLEYDNCNKIYDFLLEKHKNVFFINFMPADNDNMNEDFVDISFEKNSVTLFDQIEEFNDKDFNASEC